MNPNKHDDVIIALAATLKQLQDESTLTSDDVKELKPRLEHVVSPADLNDVVKALDELPRATDVKSIGTEAITFPVLLQSGAPDDGPRMSGTPGGTSLASTAQGALRQVLGWRYRGDDVKGFSAALQKSFTLENVGDQVKWRWNAQNFTLQANMGELKGAQASTYAATTFYINQALPLVARVEPLKTDVDPEDIAATKALCRTALQQLAAEFGVATGPRTSRVASLFAQLIGRSLPDQSWSQDPALSDAMKVLGNLGTLRDRLGLREEYVNTIEEEQNLANYRMLVGYVYSVWVPWIAQQTAGESDKSFGAEMIIFVQRLDAIVESVQEACAIMDSAYLSESERQLLRLTNSKMTLGELLAWVRDFAANEARELIGEAGKDGLATVAATMKILHRELTNAAGQSYPRPQSLKSGFHSHRVHRALMELSRLVNDACVAAAALAVDRSSVFTDETAHEIFEEIATSNDASLKALVAIIARHMPPPMTAKTVVSESQGSSRR